jgi:predicted RNase H-like HicB family nuclease
MGRPRKEAEVLVPLCRDDGDHTPKFGYTVSAMIMRYTVVLQQTEEGFSVGCPGLPGCWSQGATEQEALENIQAAIQEYLAAVRDSLQGGEMREVEVTV